MSDNPLDKDTIEKASAEASQRHHEFNAKERIEFVKKMIGLVRIYKGERLSKGEIQERVPEFARDYPHLFNMVMDSSDSEFDKQNLAMMLGLLEKMNSGALSQHQASVIVGDRLLKKYHRGPGTG
jgi:hypothetical protein